MASESGTRFVVQWEEHPSHLASRLGQLLESQTLVDVTLMCNTHTLRVHRSVLAACSPYFENLLTNISQRQLIQHPLIVLKDMQFSVLKCMIEFMYCGETNVTEEDLGPLLQAARFFQVKGLSSMTKEALGLPPRPAAATAVKAKVNGEVTKSPQKPAPGSKLVKTTYLAGLTTNTTTTTTAALAPKTPAPKQFAVRESPGLRLVTTEPAELLLSLSGNSKTIQQQTKLPSTTTKQVVGQQRSSVTRPSGAAVDSSFQLAPNQPEGSSSPVYQPGPRKRGRPLKRQMNLVFQEKVISDTEMALRKEAEASRKALENLQKVVMVTEDSDPQGETAAKEQTDESVINAKVVTQESKSDVGEQDTSTTEEAAAEAATTETAEDNAVTVEEVQEKSEEGTIVYDAQHTQVMSAQYLEVLKEAGLPSDVPILMESGDGNYITVSEEVLMSFVNGGASLQYQVTEESLPMRKDDESTSTEVHEELQQQVVRYVDDNGDIVEGVLAVVQEGEEGTTVAVTPSGEVLHIQGTFDGENFHLVEASENENNEGLISGDVDPPVQENSVEVAEESKESPNKRPLEEDSEEAPDSKKLKSDDGAATAAE